MDIVGKITKHSTDVPLKTSKDELLNGLNNKNITNYIKECVNWIDNKSTQIRSFSEEELIWIDNQVKFRFGRAYDKIIKNKWDDIYPHIMSNQKINRWLKPSDNTYEKVQNSYNTWGEYRHGETTGQVIIFNLLRANADDNLLLPIIMVDTMGPSPYSYWAYNRKHKLGEHILFPLCSHRIEYIKGLNDNTSWHNKLDKLVFRGVTTSPLVSTINNGIVKSSRVQIVSQWYDKSWANLGFNRIIDSTKKHPKWSEYESLVNSLVKPHMSIPDMLKYKFILCPEGQDIGTSFGWILASNSVPICPYPFVYEVWFFNTLEPWKHFIPCKPDGSDIEELMYWANNHDEECKIIGENGRKHMEKMLDPDLYIQVLRDMYKLWNLQHRE